MMRHYVSLAFADVELSAEAIVVKHSVIVTLLRVTTATLHRHAVLVTTVVVRLPSDPGDVFRPVQKPRVRSWAKHKQWSTMHTVRVLFSS